MSAFSDVGSFRSGHHTFACTTFSQLLHAAHKATRMVKRGIKGPPHKMPGGIVPVSPSLLEKERTLIGRGRAYMLQVTGAQGV